MAVAQQIAALRDSDAEARREIAAIKIRLNTIAKSAEAENKEMHSTYMAELSKLRADMSRLFDGLAERMADFRGETDQRITDLRVDMERRFTELQVEMEKRIAELRGEIEQRFGEVEKRFGGVEKRFGGVEKRIAELRGEMQTGFAELRAEMQKHANAQTRWMIGTAFTVVAMVFAMLRYVGPAGGAG